MVRVTRDRRCYVNGRRLHHGTAGLLLGAVLALGGHPLAGTVVGALLSGHDWDDRHVWLADLCYSVR